MRVALPTRLAGFLATALVAGGCAHLPATVGGAPLYSATTAADSESLACMVQGLRVGGYDISEGTAGAVEARRSGAPGFAGALTATYAVRAWVDDAGEPASLTVHGWISDERGRPESSASMPGQATGPEARPSSERVRRASTSGQERTVLRSELEPLVLRCAGSGNSDDALDVFFVGNSYTFYFELPALVEAISEALNGPRIRTESHTIGGYTLRRHIEDGHVAKVLGDAAPDGDPWEWVVLQEQSRLGVPYADSTVGSIGDPYAFLSASAELAELVRSSGSEPAFYMSWAKERFPHQIEALASAYDSAGVANDAPVAPVGRAWARVRERRPDFRLFDADGSHPSALGSYLAACVIYATLTGESPVGAPRRIVSPESGDELVSLDMITARTLQEAAWTVVRERSGS